MTVILRQALQEQYHAGLAMLADCVAKCPDDLWTSAPHPPTAWRTVWRIALHTAYYTHLYLGQSVDDYQPWPGRPAEFPELWQKPWDMEPYELPLDAAPYTKRQVLDYVAYVDALIDPTVNALDLEAPETGIPWYKDMTKLSHELLNLRHLQGHVGQLSELLMLRGIDTDWIGKRQPAPGVSARELDDERDTRFQEALANGEITGDIVAVDEQGREVKRKTSNIFDS